MHVLVFSANSAVVRQMMLVIKAQNKDARFYCVSRNKEAFVGWSDCLGGNLEGAEFFEFSETEKFVTAAGNAKTALGFIDLVIIGQGFLPEQIESEDDFSLVENCFNVNCLSVIAALISVVGTLKEQGSGKVAVISSVAGDRGRPRNFTYGAAKSAVSIYLQGLRSSLYGSGVEIYDFKLGPVDTPMTVNHEKNFSFSSAKNAASIIVSALRKKRYTCYVPSFWFWVMFVVRILPESIFQRLKFLSGR